MKKGHEDEPTITIWITKYALTKGVLRVQATFSDNGETAFWGSFNSAHGEGRQWHRVEARALELAEGMRLAKIASLQKQIAKLNKKRFTP